MITQKSKNITTIASEILQSHFETSQEFRNEFSGYIHFYAQKFTHLLSEEQYEEFERIFEEVCKSQYFQGYYLMLEILKDEDTHLTNEFIEQPIGFLTDEVPNMLRKAYQETIKEIIRTAPTQKFVMWMITNFEDIFDLVNQVILDITCLGSRKALLDERNSRGVKEIEENKSLLGNGYDYNFISPQAYIKIQTVTSKVETWDIHWWSTIKDGQERIGDITVIVIETPNEEVNGFILNIQILNVMAEHEITAFSQKIATRFSNRNSIELSNILVNVAVVEEFYQLVPQT
ncbi:hypothetical protein M3936_19285 [Sutcliffiella horikoshii]|uniref:hypothetical protein n=1 Tax=Sutcliffiella horikoshii TaxID=79883 RepID=UPI001CBBD04F|nr:hypothetical protein [Sutcliffiella horikoshii]MCM3619717.1 hypothetical protein [Sutcliffiella horikoshii]UAL49758.1 hypothetical protein K7887_22595 [Sutcliffiella horikoshii]